jgi:cell wall-associated NlpC family hydrolase
MGRVILVGISCMLAAIGSGQKPRVLGLLGQALETTRIYKAPNRGSSVYYTAKQYKYLVINEDKNTNYYKVVMNNGASGYVWREHVAQLPYRVTTGNATTSRSSGGAGSAASGAPLGNGDGRANAANMGLQYIGTPYVWGGNDIKNGIDCSAFVKDLYGRIGINLPRTAAEQARVGQKILRYEDLQAGDRLYFWEKKRNTIGHTGIYLGNGHFVHSSRGRKGVATDALTEKWRRILVDARR